jgi:hypothetical protein
MSLRSAGAAKNVGYLAQVSDTIFTRSIFSFGAFAADGGSALSVVVVAASRVPVTSTLCPTCGFIFAKSTSSRYMLFILSASSARTSRPQLIGRSLTA